MSFAPPYDVVQHPASDTERARLPAQEAAAVDTVVEKLRLTDHPLPYPHSSAVEGKAGAGLRELRPRGGRSPWRVLYARVGEVFVLLAVCPEAEKDIRGFNRGVRAAQKRLAEIELE